MSSDATNSAIHRREGEEGVGARLSHVYCSQKSEWGGIGGGGGRNRGRWGAAKGRSGQGKRVGRGRVGDREMGEYMGTGEC